MLLDVQIVLNVPLWNNCLTMRRTQHLFKQKKPSSPPSRHRFQTCKLSRSFKTSETMPRLEMFKCHCKQIRKDNGTHEGWQTKGQETKPGLQWSTDLKMKEHRQHLNLEFFGVFFSDTELQLLHDIKGWEMNESLFFKRENSCQCTIRKNCFKTLTQSQNSFYNVSRLQELYSWDQISIFLDLKHL